jgi:hypothetical protein
MRIDKLTVSSSIQIIDSNKNPLQINDNVLFVSSSGNIGIGTLNPKHKLQVHGVVSASVFLGDGSGLTGISNITFASLTGKPTGLVSSSAQLANTTIPGNLTVSGKLTAEEYYTEFVSASIIYKSGSSKFGNSLDDRHQFTGSMFVTGSVRASRFVGDGSGLTGVLLQGDYTYTASFTNTTNATVTHNLNTKNVVVSVYDTTNKLIIPDEIILTNDNTTNILFVNPRSGFAVVNTGGHIVSGTSYNITEYNTILNKPVGIVSGSSQISYSGISNKPANLISGSSQVSYSGITNKPTGIISSSAQLANATIPGNLTVSGKITAEEFHTEFVSASIVYKSGSSKFGNSLDDTHQFTGSVSITGSLRASRFVGDGSGLINVPNANIGSNSGRLNSYAVYNTTSSLTRARLYDAPITWEMRDDFGILVSENVRKAGPSTYVKIAPTTDSYNATLHSIQAYGTSSYVSAKATSLSSVAAFGLNNDPRANTLFTSIDYAWLLATGSSRIYEGTTFVGTFGTHTTDTDHSIEFAGSNVIYKKAGVVQRSVFRNTRHALALDTAFTNNNEQGLKNLIFSASGSIEDNNWTSVTWSPQLERYVAVAESGLYPIAYSTDATNWIPASLDEPITWTRNFLGTGVVESGSNHFRKTSGTVAWNASVFSSERYPRLVYTQARYSGQSVAGTLFYGLNTDSSISSNELGIDYAFYFADGALSIYESGVLSALSASFNTYTSTTVVRIEYDGTYVSYLRDGVTVRRVQRNLSGSLGLDTSFNSVTPTGGIRDVEFGFRYTPSHQWSSVTWSPQLGLFVAVSKTGTRRIRTSSNGINWNRIQEPESNAWESVIWSPELSLFVAVSSTGTSRVMTSIDGVTWTSRTAAEQNSWVSIAWSPSLSLFVAVSTDGTNRVMTSSNGITWATRSAAQQNSWDSITWSPELGLFAAVSTDGTNRVMTSTNGINWTPRLAAEQNSWKSITWSPDILMFMAVASSGTNRSMYSRDGITWVSLATPRQNEWTSVVWSPRNSSFVSVARTGIQRVMESVQKTSLNSVNPTTGFVVSATDAIQLPAGTEGQRPELAGRGMIRYNTNRDRMEYYGSRWTGISDDNNSGILPIGSTAQRPILAQTGSIRFNTQTRRVEVFTGNLGFSGWNALTFSGSGYSGGPA